MVMHAGWLLEARGSCCCPDLTLRCHQLHSKHSVHVLTLSECSRPRAVLALAMHALDTWVSRGGHKTFKDLVVYCLLLWNDVIEWVQYLRVYEVQFLYFVTISRVQSVEANRINAETQTTNWVSLMSQLQLNWCK